MEQEWTTQSINVSEYVQRQSYDIVNMIDAYLNSKHISGEKDAMGRDKPFFNIVTAVRNIWFRATDIDRKNIRFKASKVKEYVISLIANILLRDWMKREDFGKFLNEWGLTLANYGSAVVKFVEKDGKLYCMNIPWQRLIVDQIDFNSNPVIEQLYLTPGQLRMNKAYDQTEVEALIDNAQGQRETTRGINKDTKSGYIKIYEIHGLLPLSFLTGKEEDCNTYQQQMAVVSFQGTKESGFKDFILMQGKEKKSPYMITHLIETEGQTLSIGAVENLFQSQWMINHSQKAIKDQLDLASKLIFQTADPNYANKNVLSNIENGEILTHKENMPLTQVANNSHDITSLQSFGNQWKELAQEISSTPDILRGENMPSGTAYRQAAIVQQESHSNFDMMIENKGLYLEQMLRQHIIPFLKKQMDTSEEISSILEEHEITTLDAIYIPAEAAKRFNRKLVEAVVNQGELPNLEQQAIDVKQEQAILGNQRFIKPSEVTTKEWKDVLEDFEWEVDIEITDENVDKQATMDTLNNVLQVIAQNPTILQDPNAKLIFNKILEETGRVSAIELNTQNAISNPKEVGQQALQNNQGGQTGRLV